MPHFFFHYHTPQETTRDDLGCGFDTLELAYLDAYRSMVEMVAELLKAQKNPTGHWIEIADGGGRALMELHYDEIFRLRRQPASVGTRPGEVRTQMVKLKQLRETLQDECAKAQASVTRAHEVLRRARARANASF